MKLKSAVRFYIKDFMKPVIIFYGILLAVFALQVTLVSLLHGSDSTGGMGPAVNIFMLVMGMNAFKSQFKLFLQNGLSRKTLFTGFLFGVLILAAAMAVLDLAFGCLQGLFFTYQSPYMERFGILYASDAASLGDGLLWSFFSYLALGMIGFFITSLYYRLNKALKLTVSIGVPVTIFVVLPLIDSLYAGGVIIPFCLKAIAFCMGYSSNVNIMNVLIEWIMGGASGMITPDSLHPYQAMLCSAGFTVVAASLSFLLIRRATVKE